MLMGYCRLSIEMTMAKALSFGGSLVGAYAAVADTWSCVLHPLTEP